jgi:hypothetical protein
MGRLINFLLLLLLQIVFARRVNFKKRKAIRNRCENLHEVYVSRERESPPPADTIKHSNIFQLAKFQFQFI